MSNDRLTLSQIMLLTAYAIGMSGGQILFKMAAIRSGAADGTAGERLLGLLHNLYFLSALALYGLCSSMGLDSQLHAVIAGLPVRGVGIRAHTLACRFVIWRNHLVAPHHRIAFDSLWSLFRDSLREPYRLRCHYSPALIARGCY
jgi:hypothetical protein